MEPICTCMPIRNLGGLIHDQNCQMNQRRYARRIVKATVVAPQLPKPEVTKPPEQPPKKDEK